MSYPDKCLEYIENNYNVDIFDYSESLFSNTRYCFHIKARNNTNLFDGIGEDDDEEVAASKACSELLERILYGSLHMSKKFFGSSFHFNELSAKKAAKEEYIERYLFTSWLVDQKFHRCEVIEEGKVYFYEGSEYGITIYQVGDGARSFFGFCLGVSSLSRQHARNEAVRRRSGLIKKGQLGDPLISPIEDMHYRTNIEDVLSENKMLFEIKEISGLGFGCKAFIDNEMLNKYMLENFNNYFSSK